MQDTCAAEYSRSGLDQRLSLASLLGQSLVCIPDMDHPISHRMLSSWILDIGPKFSLDMCSSLVEVWRNRQHTSLTGSDSLVKRE